MPSFSSALVRIAIIVAILAADGRGLPQFSRADDGVNGGRAVGLAVVTDGCSEVSCCGAGSDCCCSVPGAGDKPAAESAASCCGGGMDQAALADDEAARGCRCSFSPVDDGPRVPMVPAQAAGSVVVDAMVVAPVAGSNGVLVEAGLVGHPGDTRDPQPDSLLRQLAVLCCWRA